MSTWTSSLFLALSLVLTTMVVMHSGCNAAAATAKRPAAPKISSVKEMKMTVADVSQRLQRAEKSLAPLKAVQSDLNRKFKSYSARTAHHEWQSADQQQSIGSHLRQDAQTLKSQIREVDHAVRNHFGPRIAILQSPTLRRFARDAPTKTQLAQSAKIYKRLLELLQNMIECPVHILEFLGEEDSIGSEPVDEPSEANGEPVSGEQTDAGYGYQYYN